jgi:hypothetical protein
MYSHNEHLLQEDAAPWNYLIAIFSHGMRLSPLGTAATVWLIVPAPDVR